MAEVLGRQLRHAVGRHGLRQGVLAHRHRHAIAIDRRARRIDEPFQHRCVPRRLEQELRRLDVVRRINAEVAAPALAHAGLRRQVKHMRAIAEKVRQVEVLNPRLEKAKARMFQGGAQVPLLRRPGIVIRKGVDADDIRAVRDQPIGDRRSDETGAAGDQRLHESTVRTRSGSRHGRPLRSSVACTVLPVASVAASAVRTTS